MFLDDGKLKDKNKNLVVNGFVIRYDLCLPRLLHQLSWVLALIIILVRTKLKRLLYSE